jgi:hypothetical protein
MMTSALALSQILSLVSSQSSNVRFLEATATCLGMEGPDVEMDVLYHLVRLTNQLETDILSLKLDDKTTVALRKEAAPFSGIPKLTQVHLTVEQAKNNFLNPTHLVGLLRLHAAFAHAQPIPELSADAVPLIKDFKSALEQLQKSNVPDELKETLSVHLRFIISSLENYYFFSSRQIDQSLATLVGTIVLSPDAVKEHSKEMNPIISAVGKLLTAFTSTGKYTAIGRKLADDGKALLDVVNQFGN